MTFIEKVKSVTIKNSPGEKARPEVWGMGLRPGTGVLAACRPYRWGRSKHLGEVGTQLL